MSLSRLILSRWYWVAQAAFATTLLLAALGYQYLLGEEPCQICIHVRLWVVALVLVSLIGLMTSTVLQRCITVLISIVALIGMGTSAYTLMRLERGVGTSSCEFQLGMPWWFAVDKWLPAIFEVRNLCTFTPMMPWRLTMAESLVIIAIVMCLFAAGKLAVELKVH